VSELGEILVGAAIGYLIGTFPSADLVTRLATRGRVDIRSAGSGNPGGLNSIRVLGKGWGVLVIVLDTAKGALAGGLGLLVGDAACYAAGAAAIAGHVWPLWTRFRGGRGVASAGGSFATVFPPFFAIGAVVAGVLAIVTRDAGFTIRILCPVWVAVAVAWWAADLDNLWGPEVGPGLAAYSVVGAVIVWSRFRPGVRGAGSGM
jgi:glycerol-3-phosphate acyltransferase PlsY